MLSSIPWLRPIKTRILIDIIDRGERISNGIITRDDDFTEAGIRPREAEILALGPDAARDHDLKVGDIVLVEHAMWSRKLMDTEMTNGETRSVWYTEPEHCLMVIDRSESE